MIDAIKRNIKKHRFHVYVVDGGPTPRFSYTIGLLDSVGAEVVFAGGAFFEATQCSAIVDSISKRLLDSGDSGRSLADLVSGIFPVDGIDTFTLRRVHKSWGAKMLLGALDYYGADDVSAYQIVPSIKHITLDVPDLSRPRSKNAQRAWAWLDEEWPYRVPKNTCAMTNLLALRGARIGEAVRFKDGWHLYASQDHPVEDEDLRILPLGALLGADPSLEPVVGLELGEALWRGEGDWETWE